MTSLPQHQRQIVKEVKDAPPQRHDDDNAFGHVLGRKDNENVTRLDDYNDDITPLARLDQKSSWNVMPDVFTDDDPPR
jgi:hypothetical protein